MPAASRPLFRDPVHDGAADPIVIWNRTLGAWWMFYTNRRAKDPAIPDIAWVHGTRLGIAESRDGGATWRHLGSARIDLPPELGHESTITHWAPEILFHEGLHHMYLTVVPGIFDTWQHPRSLVHLTSPDLQHWTYRSTLKLASDRVIDACVARLPSGKWRMWYNDERAGKAINAAESDDLFTWRDLGLVELPDRHPGEGPKVFRFADAWWMIVDEWRGQAVYRSSDAIAWTRQPGENLLAGNGRGPDDTGIGAHADVVVHTEDGRERAWIFYFTHPERVVGAQPAAGANLRRSTVHVAELALRPDGWLACDRDAPASIRLAAPSS